MRRWSAWPLERLPVVFASLAALTLAACSGRGAVDSSADDLDPALVEGPADGARRPTAYATQGDLLDLDEALPDFEAGVRPATAPPRPAFLEPGAALLSLPRAEADLLLWRAGSGLLVGLPGARAAERARNRESALADLAARLAPDSPERSGWMFHLAARLGENVPEELWCATARTAGELGLYELGDRIAFGLREPASPRRRAAAQEGLHALYGHWFQTRDQAAPFVESVAAGPGTALLLDSLLREEALATERLLEVLDGDIEGTLARLEDPNPRLRAGVASLLGDAMSRGDADAATLLPVLFARAENEVDSGAYAAVLDAILVPLENAASDSPELDRFATILAARVEVGANELGVPIAQALARLPWDARGTLATVSLVGRLLETHLASEDQRGIQDADAAVSMLLALEALCRGLRGTPEEVALRASEAREPVFAIVSDPIRDEATRAAAAGAFDAFVRPEDGERLLAVLTNVPPPALAHALVRPLRSILLACEPQDARARTIIDALAFLAGHPDPDLRRRALGVLADEELAPLVERIDAARLARLLGQEEVTDLSIVLLKLVRRFGTPELMPTMLALESLPRLAAGATLGELTLTLDVLADGQPGPTFAAASRLVKVEGDETKLNRTRRALSLIAGLSDEAARGLAPEDNRYIGAWATTLHRAGVPLEEATPEGLDFVERLVELHLPGSAREEHGTQGSQLFGEAERQYMLAVLLGRLVIAKRTGLATTEVEAAFERANEFAAIDDPELVDLIYRDRARFHERVGERLAALNDYRVLLGDSGANRAVDNDDLRTAARLANALDPKKGSTAGEVFGYLARLVERPSWRSEPGAVRVQDLQAVVDAALLLGDLAALERVRAYFDGLPADVVANGTSLDETRPWSGLARNAEWLETLHGAAQRVETLE